MTHSGRSRGRPRGTGIDDSVHLEKMKQILDREPELRPTTAIRLLGIQNESVIRRLRDKYHATYGRDGVEELEHSTFRRDERGDGPSVVALSSGLDNVRKSAVAKPARARQAPAERTATPPVLPCAANDIGPETRPAAERKTVAADEASVSKAAEPKPIAPASQAVAAHPAPALEAPALLVSALSTAVAAVNLFTVQQVLLWRMTARHPMAAAFLVADAPRCCPTCGNAR